MRKDFKRIADVVLADMTTAGKAVGNYGIRCAKNYLRKQEEENKILVRQNALIDRANYQEELRLELSSLLENFFSGLSGYSIDIYSATHMRCMGMRANNVFIFGIPKTSVTSTYSGAICCHLKGLVTSALKTEVQNAKNYYGVNFFNYYPILAMRNGKITGLSDTGVEFVIKLELK